MIYANQAKKLSVREYKGRKIAKLGDQVKRIDQHTYKVKSQSSNNWYEIISIESGWKCSCPDHTFRKVCCKHIHAVEFSLKIRKEVQINKIEPINVQACEFCNSTNFIKNSIRHNKYGNIQRYKCKNCNKRFSINLGFEKMRASPQIITSAMQLYFTGESLRNVTKFLKLQGIEVSHVAVYKWIKKYVELMQLYLNKITPQVGDRWRSDELFLKIKGNTKYLYALMDDETRFIIAQQIANTKYKEDIQQLFQEGKRVAQKKPTVLITDGAKNFHQAYLKEFRTIQKPRTQHIRHIHFKGDKNNNKMERLNGEIRDREKVMRGLKKPDTPILDGYRIFHNFIRTHEGLGGITPAQACGFDVRGNNKWLTLIQNAKFSSSGDLSREDRGR